MSREPGARPDATSSVSPREHGAAKSRVISRASRELLRTSLLAWLGWSCTIPHAQAQRVRVDLDACHEPPEAEVQRLLALELSEGTQRAGELATIDVQCTDDVATLAVRGSERGRTLALDSVPPELRARLLALAIAELAQLPVAPPSAPAPPPAPVAATTTRAEPQVAIAQAPLPRTAIWLSAAIEPTPLFAVGAALSARVRLRRRFALASALGFSHARTEIDRGQLRVSHGSLRTGPALLLENSRASLHAGAGVRAGFLALAGRASDPAATAEARFHAFYAGPALFVGGGLALGKHAFVALELELHHTLRRVRAEVQGGGARTLHALRSLASLGVGARW